jgi:hypothetical protein
MHRYERIHPLVAASFVAVMLGGCMPKAFKIDHGTHPERVDEHVRFRTTYYFRVFGDCFTSDGVNGELPEYSGLYRFRMTGKAQSLTNKVRFESGVLPERSIDPFGVSLRYDDNTDSLLFRDAHAEEKTRVAKELVSLVEKLRAIQASMTAPADAATKASLDGAVAAVAAETGKLISAQDPASVNASIDRLVKVYEGFIKFSETQGTAEEKAEFQQAARKRLSDALNEVVTIAKRIAQGKACTSNDRGFMILGPEGWRQFNPDERLIMAMYSSGRPLISTLNELSARALNMDANSAEVGLAYSRENARIVKSLTVLNDFESDRPESGPDVIKNAVAALSAKQP